MSIFFYVVGVLSALIGLWLGNHAIGMDVIVRTDGADMANFHLMQMQSIEFQLCGAMLTVAAIFIVGGAIIQHLHTRL